MEQLQKTIWPRLESFSFRAPHIAQCFVASLTEGNKCEETFKYKRTTAADKDKVKVLDEKKKSIDYALSYLKVWSTGLEVFLGVSADAQLYANYRQKEVFVVISSDLI